jgi:hypothetical protein
VSEGEPQIPELARERIQFERDRIQLERDKLAVEQSKARWTAVSISVPLVVAVFTVAFGIWAQYQQAQSQFEIKAAEIVCALPRSEG